MERIYLPILLVLFLTAFVSAATIEDKCDKNLLFFESHKEQGMEGAIEVVD